jgi:uncharacterized protein YidB (DUF937 family)
MGLLDGILGGFIGGQMATVVNQLIEKHGGIAGIAEQFQKQGFGPTVQSWIGTGENQPISGTDLDRAVGSDTLAELAAKFGMSKEDLAAKLAEILPTAIDKMTPTGKL